MCEGEIIIATTKTDIYASEAAWTMTQTNAETQTKKIICSLSGLTNSINHNIETKCCVDKNQSIELECTDSYSDGWSHQYEDAGLTFDGETYCDGSFKEESLTITFSGMNFILLIHSFIMQHINY